MNKMRYTCTLAVTGAMIFAFSMRATAQQELPTVTVTAQNYKYLNAVNPEEAPEPVNMLQQYAAAYDVKSAPFYDEEFDNYVVSFYIPEGKILAHYDNDGNLVQTAERYKDVKLPAKIIEAVAKQYPGWAISKDVYLVNYYNKKEVTSKIFKLTLDKGGKRLRIKINENAEFL